MDQDEFIRYVGPTRVHDARIVAVEHRDESLTVRVQGDDGDTFALTFSGVVEVNELRPEGMILYSIAEMEARPPYRRFVFTNTDEEAVEFLEVIARAFEEEKGR